MRERTIAILPQWLLLAVALVAIVGCVGERKETVVRNTPAFPHNIHVVDEEMECAACHKLDDKSGKYSMPVKATCMKCHEGLDKDKPAEKQAATFFKDDQPQWVHITRLPAETIFSHQPHNAANLKCGTCHKGIEKSKSISSKLRLEMPDCIACHKKQQVGQAQDNCAVCHTVIGKQWRPVNHERDWIELHGRVAPNVSKGSAGDCMLCHKQSTCTNCHRAEEPKSHTNFWRQRGHGVQASIDRSSCRTCHTEDSCMRCHKQVAPRNHKANWADRHCTNCHFPLNEEGCFACHKSAPSHAALATPLPNNRVHQQATPDTCRTCHFPGRLLPHPDPGGNCLDCHPRP